LKELDPDWATAVRDGFYPSLLAANSYQDSQYAVPTSADATVLWYRRDWFEAEGLTPPSTWAELLTVAQHFHQPKTRARYNLGASPLSFVGGRAGGETTTYQLLPFVWSAGGDLITQEKVVLNSDATRKAIRFLQDLVQHEQLASPAVIHQRWDSTAHAFARGEVAMAIGGTYENFIIQSAAQWDPATFLLRVGFVPIPAGPNGAPTTLLGGMTYGIYRQSRHPQEALALLKLALTPKVLKPFSLLTGQNPSFTAIGQSIRAEEDGFLGRASHIFEQGRSRPSLPAYDRVSQQFQEMIELSLSGQLSVDAAVSRAAERISGITGLPVA
ncbi:MAG TPA: extracellular solute-binding protein, partial [Anaerolineae bacterium]|nr:extracellular solute-binding protein [Anaerolineae bacterium]